LGALALAFGGGVLMLSNGFFVDPAIQRRRPPGSTATPTSTGRSPATSTRSTRPPIAADAQIVVAGDGHVCPLQP
jgi:hypothetical protein